MPSSAAVLHAVVGRTAAWGKATEIITTNSLIRGTSRADGTTLQAPLPLGYSTIDKAIGELVELGLISTEVKHWKVGCSPTRHITLHIDELLLAGYNAAHFNESESRRMTEIISHLKIPKSVRKNKEMPYSTKFLYKKTVLKAALKSPQENATVVRNVSNNVVNKNLKSQSASRPAIKNPTLENLTQIENAIVVRHTTQAETLPTPTLESALVEPSLPRDDNKIVQVNQRLTPKAIVQDRVLQVVANRASRVNQRVAQKDSIFPPKRIFMEMWENAMREFAPDDPIGAMADVDYYKFRAAMGIRREDKLVSLQDKLGFPSMEEFLKFCITDWARVVRKSGRGYIDESPSFKQLPMAVSVLMPAFIAHKVGKKRINESVAKSIRANNERLTEMSAKRAAEKKQQASVLVSDPMVLEMKRELENLRKEMLAMRVSQSMQNEFKENPEKFLKDNYMEPIGDFRIPEWDEISAAYEREADEARKAKWAELEKESFAKFECDESVFENFSLPDWDEMSAAEERRKLEKRHAEIRALGVDQEYE